MKVSATLGDMLNGKITRAGEACMTIKSAAGKRNLTGRLEFAYEHYFDTYNGLLGTIEDIWKNRGADKFHTFMHRLYKAVDA
jgi:hypothetical protein